MPSRLQILFWLIPWASFGAFLFDVPGYHFDEAWIARYAESIAFERGFWPGFGMNDYTVPVMSYLIAGVYRILGVPSLEAARILYATLALSAITLLGLTLRRWKVNPWPIPVLFGTLPLAVFCARLHLEVTSGYLFFFSVALYGFTRATASTNLFWPSLAIISITLGSLSHALFISFVLSAVASIAFHSPEWLRTNRIKTWITLSFAPLFALLGQYAIKHGTGNAESIKSLIALSIGSFALYLLWSERLVRFVQQPGTQKLASFLRVLSAYGFFFFLGFEGLGFWPISQVNGVLRWEFVVPGALFLTAAGMIWRATPKEHLFWKDWLIWSVFLSSLIIYKPSSGKYWQGPLAIGILWLTIAIAHLGRQPAARRAILLITLSSVLHAAMLWSGYFSPLLQHGATSAEYRFLGIKDRALYYRPILRPYAWLREHRGACQQDAIHVDFERNQFVLDTIRDFERARGESACPQGHSPRTYYLGTPEWAARLEGATWIAEEPAWGDIVAFEAIKSR